MNCVKNGRKLLLASVALATGLGFAFNAQAQTCTVANWDAAPNLVDGADNASGDVGTQPNGFKRYGGPCGVTVPFGSPSAYVENSSQGGAGTSPLDEAFYIGRFYVYLGEVTASGGAAIFTAFDSSDSELFSVVYDSDGPELSFNVVGATNPSPVSIDAGKWQSIEFIYDVSGNEFTFSVSRALDEDGDDTVDAHATVVSGTAGNNVAVVQMGNIDGIGSGFAYFDDFDSRRSQFPGRLLVADGNNDGTVNLGDVIAARAEHLNDIPAAGQPDCNEDGQVNLGDVICARAIHLSE